MMELMQVLNDKKRRSNIMELYFYSIAVISLMLVALAFTNKTDKSKKFLVILYVVTNLIYLVWRGIYTLPDI